MCIRAWASRWYWRRLPNFFQHTPLPFGDAYVRDCADADLLPRRRGFGRGRDLGIERCTLSCLSRCTPVPCAAGRVAQCIVTPALWRWILTLSDGWFQLRIMAGCRYLPAVTRSSWTYRTAMAGYLLSCQPWRCACYYLAPANSCLLFRPNLPQL